MTKTELVQTLADGSGITKAQAKQVLDLLAQTAEDELKATGEFKVPDLVTLKLADRPATPERQGVNPFTKLAITIPAKAASKKVKALPAAALRKAVA